MWGVTGFELFAIMNLKMGSAGGQRNVQMAIAEHIIAARIFGAVRCGLSLQNSPTLQELVRELGLREDACYREIDESSARQLIQSVLHKDMAYGAEVMSEARATGLAEQFLAQFGQGTLYFSNRTRHLPRADGLGHVTSWDPATMATFDTGVLAIGPGLSGCLWVEDKD